MTENKIEIEGFGHFAARASSVSLFSYGRKETPFGHPNYLDVWDVLPGPKIQEVELIVTEMTVEFVETKGIKLFANLKLPGMAQGKVGLDIEDFSSGRYVLSKISPKGEADLIRQINASPKMKEKLIDFGQKARIAKSILFASEAKTYHSFSGSLTSSGAVLVDGVLVGVERKASQKSASTVEVKDATVGYALAEPKWNAHQDKNKTAVTDLRDDQPSFQL